MTKKEFWKGLDRAQRVSLADGIGTTPEYLRQVFMYGKHTGAQRARRLAAATGGVIGAHEFCPDAFDEADSLHVHSDQRASA